MVTHRLSRGIWQPGPWSLGRFGRDGLGSMGHQRVGGVQPGEQAGHGWREVVNEDASIREQQ